MLPKLQDPFEVDRGLGLPRVQHGRHVGFLKNPLHEDEGLRARVFAEQLLECGVVPRSSFTRFASSWSFLLLMRARILSEMDSQVWETATTA